MPHDTMPDVSVIIPVCNGQKWIDSCMESIVTQTAIQNAISLEIVVCNDGSTDNTSSLLEKWAKYFNNIDIPFVTVESPISKGVGAAKNAAVQKSTGQFLCFQDIDDIMHSDRILHQWKAATSNCNAIIGSKISRIPSNSTPRFVNWANNLKPNQLKVQIYTSNGPTLLMPTWFFHRSVFTKVGMFDESGRGTPEDLIFFYKHLDYGGDLLRVDEKLVLYTYHESATTFSVTSQCIWNIQLNRLEELVLPKWKFFTVWNAGKAGRKLIRSLSSENLKKVRALCDVDDNKIGRDVEFYCPVKRKVFAKVPVIHFRNAVPPLLICVKLDLTNGQFENNLRSLNLVEGTDYILFS